MGDVLLVYNGELVKELLYLKDEWEIVGGYIDKTSPDANLNLIIRHDDFPETISGERIPQGTLRITSKTVVDSVEMEIL